jgi:hypothetical protein
VGVVIEVDRPAEQQPNGLLMRPGMFVSVQIEGHTLDGAFRLPPHALRIDERVWVVRQPDPPNESQREDVDGVLVKVPVKVLRWQEGDVFVSGLRDGEQVIVSSMDTPVEGMALRTYQPQSGEPEPSVNTPRQDQQPIEGSSTQPSANQRDEPPVTRGPGEEGDAPSG